MRDLSPQQTQASNKNKYPGLPDLVAERHSSDEVRKMEEKKKQTKTAAARQQQENIARVAALEESTFKEDYTCSEEARSLIVPGQKPQTQ